MKTKTIATIILGIFLLSFATAIYPGENVTFENPLNNVNLIWTIVGNSTNITILPEITINSTHIHIYLPANMPPNSFTLVFLEETTKEVIKEVVVYRGGGGGSSGTKYIENKTYVEVPNYITHYENVTTEVPGEVIKEKEIVKEKNYLTWWHYLIIFFAIVIGYLIKYLIDKKRYIEVENK